MKILLAAGVAVVCLFVTEVGLRLIQMARHDTPFFSVLPSYRPTRFPLSPFLVFGPRVDWQIDGRSSPDTAYFNTQGYRTQEPLALEKPPGEMRIFALGGSTTENVWNEAGTHWPLELERELHRMGYPEVRVYNGAMSAYSTAHSLVRLAQDVIAYDPDLVIVMHNVNDLTVNYHAVLAGVPVDHNYLVKYGKENYTGEIDEDDVAFSRLAWSVGRRLRALAGREPARFPDAYELEGGLETFRRNLVSMNGVARAHGVPVVLLTMPFSRDREIYDFTQLHQSERIDPVPDYERFLRDADRYNAAILDVAREHGVPSVDMASMLPDGPDVFADVVHYHTRGLQLFGQTLARELAPMVENRHASQ